MSFGAPSTSLKDWSEQFVKAVKAAIDKLDSTLNRTTVNHVGDGEPSSIRQCMWWADTGNMLLKIRNSNNTAWITAGTLDATFLGLVALTTDQLIAGIKTFSSFPVTPSATPASDYEVANKKYVDDTATGLAVGLKKIVEVSLAAEASKTISSSLSPGKRYQVVISLRKNTADGYVALRVNGDTGTNYDTARFYVDRNQHTVGGSGSDSYNKLTFNNLVNAYSLLASVLVTTDPSDNKVVSLLGEASYWDSAGSPCKCGSSCRYVGAADFSTLSILTDAGTLTGAVTIYELL